MNTVTDQDLAIHDAIMFGRTRHEIVTVAEVLCDAREAFARLYEVVALDGTDDTLENAKTIVRAAQAYVTHIHELVGENVGENE